MHDEAVAHGDQAYGVDVCGAYRHGQGAAIERVIRYAVFSIALWFCTIPPSWSQNMTALHDAVRAGDLTQVQALIASGSELNARNAAQETPLLVAVQADRLEIALALIAAGADINAQAANKDSPWLLAGAAGRTEMIRAMIPKGPDFAKRNRYGGNALIPACERGHVETIELLLTTAIDVDHVNNLGWTCLLEIVILGDGGVRHQQAAKLVLAAGADPNLADKDGVTPLQHARNRGQDAIAAMIEKAGGR